jgi:hypothetical protein
MSQLVFLANAGGNITFNGTNTANAYSVTVPAANGTLAYIDGSNNLNTTNLVATGTGSFGGTLSVTGATSLSTLSTTGDAIFGGTGEIQIPSGTTAQRSATPAQGMIRYNITNSNFEGYNGSAWGSIAVPAGSNTQIQYNNSGALGASSAFTFDGTSLTVPKIAFANSNTPSLTNYQGGALISGTAVASTSGTSIDFTSIPSWVKRITVMFAGVSTNGTSDYWLRLGTSGGFTTSGYIGYVARQAGGSNSYTAWSSAAVLANGFLSTEVFSGLITIDLINSSTNTWVIAGQITGSNSTGNFMNMAGYVPLSGALTQIRLTSATPDTFDAGSINILYE